ncbi:MAG: hypothetical protein C0594_00170, partial [Marinilabiliales bacterium]
MSEINSPYNFDSSSLLAYINRRKLPLIIITLIAVVVSTVVSLLIEEKYRSTVVLYPTSSASVSNSLLSDKIIDKEILNFGEEEEVEQLIQILHSYAIRDRIIQKYNLMDHYDIDLDSKFPKTHLFREMESNISFKRTEFMSIEIEVLDKDPVIAAKIANDIAALVDTTMNAMQHERANKALKIVENEYLNLVDRVSDLEDSLTAIRKKGVIYYESQAEVFNDAYATAILEGKTGRAKEIEKKLAVLAEYGGAYVSLRDLLLHETEKLSILESKYREAKVDAQAFLPHKYIVNRGEVAEKKAYPIRWLIVLISTLGAFIFALFTIIVYDNVKK